jgi:hypothetical protein
MEPEQYIDRLGEMIASGRDREALAYAKEVRPSVAPRLTPEQIELAGGLLEGAAMLVAMEDAEMLGEVESSAAGAARSR